jgi:hypothetical protein
MARMKTKRFRFLPFEYLENMLMRNPIALMKMASQLSQPSNGINPIRAMISPIMPKIVEIMFIMC